MQYCAEVNNCIIVILEKFEAHPNIFFQSLDRYPEGGNEVLHFLARIQVDLSEPAMLDAEIEINEEPIVLIISFSHYCNRLIIQVKSAFISRLGVTSM